MNTTAQPTAGATHAHRWGDHKGGEVVSAEARGTRLVIVLRLPTGEFYERSIPCMNAPHAEASRIALMWIEGIEVNA